MTDLRSLLPLPKREEKPSKVFYLEPDIHVKLNNISFVTETLGRPLLSQAKEVDTAGRTCDKSYDDGGDICNPETDEHSCSCFHFLEVLFYPFYIRGKPDRDL